MPLDLIPNAMLKARGWTVFRSSSRDRLIPLTSLSSVAQRIRLNDVVAPEGVGVGEAVLSEADVKARLEAEQAVTIRLRNKVQQGSQSMGVRQEVQTNIPTLGGPGIVIGENRFLVMTAPSDGWVVSVAHNFGGNQNRLALRTTSGRTFFIGRGGSNNVGNTPALDPDFTELATVAPNWGTENVRIPVLAGEDITAVFDSVAATPDTQHIGFVKLIFEYAVGGVSQSDAFGADFGEVRIAMRQQAEQASRLASDQLRLEIERERTRRAQIEAQAKAAALNRIPAAAPKVASRAPVQPPPLFASEAPTAEGGGKGKTFVSAWMPSNGYVGYYIPDPPPGGKVNVFDGRYTIWDVGGRNVGSGPVEWVRQDQQLQEGTRISRNLGVRAGSTLPTTSYIPGVGFL